MDGTAGNVGRIIIPWRGKKSGGFFTQIPISFYRSFSFLLSQEEEDVVEEEKKKDGNVSKKINHRLTPFVKYNNDKGKEDPEDIHKKKKS